jgi:hypothetical protein
VPYVVGQRAGEARRPSRPRATPRRCRPIPSSLPHGQVVGESPQGNLAHGTSVTIWTSAGK